MIDARPTLVEIDHALAHWLEAPAAPGLLDGSCGVALFYAYYSALTGCDEHVERVHGIVADAVDALGTRSLTAAHCGGVAGIAWCLHHLVERGLVEAADDVFEAVDDMLCAAIVTDVRAGARDVLHDGFGAALYLGERAARPRVRASLETVVEELEQTAVRDARGTRWIDDRTGTFNLGLAHGNPGILTLIAHLHRRGIARPRTAALLEDGVRWLRSTRFPDPGAGSHFPTAVDATGAPTCRDASRLGWCYGDLGVAVSLLQAGTAMGDRTCIDDAAALLHHATLRRSAEDGYVHDAALCHGSMGIAQIYRRASFVTGDAALLACADRWIEHGLSLARWTDGSAGFKYAMRDRYVPSCTLLQGVAGIGLALISAMGPESESAWDRSLVLS